MDYTHLGRTGLSVSRLCLGTMNFGPQTSEADSFAIMDRAHEHGINFFDTANVYGWKKGEGVTEQIVGRWFAQGGGRREKTVLATKLYGDMGDWPNDSLLSRAEHPTRLRRLAAAAADRLHRPLPDAPRRPGDAVGGDLGGDGGPAAAGQDPLRRLVQLRRLAHRPGRRRPRRAGTSSGWCPSSRIYNLLDARRSSSRSCPAAETTGSASSRGRRSRRPARRRPAQGRGGPARGGGPCQETLEKHRDADRGVRGVLRRARRATRPTSAWPGCSTSRRDRADHRAADDGAARRLAARAGDHLDEERSTRLDEIFPGPGGTAPEAYAW